MRSVTHMPGLKCYLCPCLHATGVWESISSGLYGEKRSPLPRFS